MKRPVTLLLAIVLFFTACKKNVYVQNEKTIPNTLKKENGHLVFKDYDEFFTSLLIASNMTKSQRDEFEKNNSFKSFYSYAEEILNQLNERTPQSNALLEEIKSGKNEYVYYDQTMGTQMKVRNILESHFMTKEKIIKVENDYLVYDNNSFVTYRNISFEDLRKIQSSANAASRVLVGTASVNNHYTVTRGIPKITNSAYDGPGGRMYTNLQLYNIHTAASGHRGFITLTYWAEQKDMFTDYRPAYCKIDLISCGIDLKFSNNTSHLIGFWGDDGLGSHPVNLTGYIYVNETVLAVSSYLKNVRIPNSHPLGYYSNHTSGWAQIGNALQEVNDDAISSINGYWKEINTVTTNPNTSLWIEGTSNRSALFVQKSYYYRIEEN